MFNLLFVPLLLESNWYTFELFPGILLSYHLQIWFRMTDEEKSRLQEMASNSGRTVSGYIRSKLFGGEKATINAVEFLKEYKTQIHEMQKIGNNINQLAHYANICIKSGVVSEAVVQEMNQTIGELTKIEIKLEDIMRRIVKG